MSDASSMAFRSSDALICGVIFCECYLFIFALFCPFVRSLLVVGLTEQLGKAHISTFQCAEKPLSQSKPGGAFSSEGFSGAETLPLANVARSEMFRSRSVLHVFFTNAGAGSQDVERRNTELEGQIQSAEKTLASSQEEQAQAEVEVRRVIEVLDVKICDLSDLRQSLAKLITN